MFVLVFVLLLGGAVALLPVFAKDVLHVGAAGLGVLRGAPGTGTVLGISLAALGSGVVASEPKKIRTIAIHPDQPVVADAAPSSMSAAAAPARPAPAPAPCTAPCTTA